MRKEAEKTAQEEHVRQLIETFLKVSEKVYVPDFVSVENKAKLSELYPENAQVYIDFLSSLASFECRDQNKAVLEALLNHDVAIDEKSLQGLKDIYEENLKPNPRVEKGLKVLQDFFKKPKPVIIDGKDYGYPWKLKLQFFNAIILIFGSLEFRDPQNLDADIVIAAAAFPGSIRMGEEENWEFNMRIPEELLPYWFKRGMGNKNKMNEPHINVVDLNLGHDLADFIKNAPKEYQSFAEHLSVILSGMLLYPEDQRLFELMQREARVLIESNPLTCAIVNYQLRETLDIRLERRSNRLGSPAVLNQASPAFLSS